MNEQEPIQGAGAVPSRVVISGLEIPFADLVTFLIKLAFAAIPAAIIIAVIGGVATAIAIAFIRAYH